MLGVGLAGGLLLGCVLTYWTTVRPLRRQSSVLLYDGERAIAAVKGSHTSSRHVQVL